MARGREVVVRFRGDDYFFHASTLEELHRAIAVRIGVPVERQKLSRKLPQVLEEEDALKPLRVMLIGTVALPDATPRAGGSIPSRSTADATVERDLAKPASSSSLVAMPILASPVDGGAASPSDGQFPFVSSRRGRLAHAASIEELREAIADDSDDSDQPLRLAELILDSDPDAEMGAEAVALAERALRLLDLRLPVTDHQQRALSLAKGAACITLVTACLVSGTAEDYKKAIEYAVRASVLVPEYNLGHVVGFALHRAGKSNEAVAFLRTLTEARFDDPLPLFFLAIILSEQLLDDSAASVVTTSTADREEVRDAAPMDKLRETVGYLHAFISRAAAAVASGATGPTPLSGDDIVSLQERSFWCHLQLAKLAARFSRSATAASLIPTPPPMSPGPGDGGPLDGDGGAEGGVFTPAVRWACRAAALSQNSAPSDSAVANVMAALLKYVDVTGQLEANGHVPQLEAADEALTETLVTCAAATSANFTAKALQAHIVALQHHHPLTTRQLKSLCELVCLLGGRGGSHLHAASLLRGILRSEGQLRALVTQLPGQPAPRILFVERLCCDVPEAAMAEATDMGDGRATAAEDRVAAEKEDAPAALFTSSFGVTVSVSIEVLQHFAVLSQLLANPASSGGELLHIVQLVMVFGIPLPAAEELFFDQLHDTLVREALVLAHERLIRFLSVAARSIAAGIERQQPHHHQRLPGELTAAVAHFLTAVAQVGTTAADSALVGTISDSAHTVATLRDSFMETAGAIFAEFAASAWGELRELRGAILQAGAAASALGGHR